MQVLAQMVLTELGKAWKALGAGEKATYEESAKEEKALVQKAAQSEAKRVPAGDAAGGVSKLRDQIEAFAKKQPEAFLQLYDKLVADEVRIANSITRQQEKEKKAQEKEAEMQFPGLGELPAGRRQ